MGSGQGQLGEDGREHAGAEHQIGLVGVLGGVMADAAVTGDEEHGGGAAVGEIHGVVKRAGYQAAGGGAGGLTGGLDDADHVVGERRRRTLHEPAHGGPAVARALGDFLTREGRRALVIAPRDRDATWEDLVSALYRAEPEPRGVVILIGSDPPPAAAREGLRRLNQHQR